ncbi:MAG: diacylglycerol kinase family lipid kinase [Bacteroidia bacterium]|nr:diacylglycerol kinase family lipid kinase [Bacteroidia bacterium]
MKQNSTILFLVNPFAGKGNALNTANNAIAVMHQNGYDTQLLVSKNTGDLANFVHQFKVNNISKIAVLGGDGTMHEVINAMMHEPEWLAVPIMLFPCGTGNAFNYDLDCLTSKKATQLLLTGTDKLIDIAEVKTNNTSIWSFNIVGCGLVADINVLAERLRWLGAARYTIASLIKIIANPTIKAKITVNNEVHYNEYCFLFACNTRYTGKAMKMAPLAKLNDGLIDFLIVEKASRLKLLMLFPKVFSGKHMNSPIVKYVQSKQIKIETETSQIVNIDGETKGNTSIEIIMHQQKLKVICD